MSKKPTSFSCDSFSYGMVLWELLDPKHRVPFEEDTEVVAAAKIIGGQVTSLLMPNPFRSSHN